MFLDTQLETMFPIENGKSSVEEDNGLWAKDLTAGPHMDLELSVGS